MVDDKFDDLYTRKADREKAWDQVCASLDFMRFTAIQTGDVKVLQEIETNIAKYCQNRVIKNVGFK